ncbi:MAG: outer membrane protein transport protein [Candidatus Omnitrophica bacterium]|nr:outer membrane protein transport protein [Candidatus Omnitrophota bacterium]
MGKRLFLLLAVALMAACCSSAFAAGSGGFKVEVPDARALSMGGAFVGLADNASAVYYNPAGMIQLKKPEVSVNLSLVQPKGRENSDVKGKTKMQQDSFLIPSMFFVSPVGEKVALGLGATSSWGLGTNWAQDSFARYAATQTTMQNHDYYITGAYKLTEQLSFGAGVVIDDSKAIKERKINQNLLGGGYSDANFKLEGNDAAPGFQLSGLYKFNDRHQIGIQYVSEIHHNYGGKVHLDNLNNNGLAAYGGGNFSSSSYETDVTSKATLPQSIDLGYSFRPTEKLTLNADVLWMDWSSIEQEAMVFPNESDPSRLAVLNAGNPANRDWHSAWSLGLGTEYKYSDRLRLRGGYYFHQSPVPQDTWSPSVPDANSHSIATGFGYDVTKALTIDLAYSAMFYDTRSIKNGVADGVGGSVDGKYSQWTNLVLLTATYKF